MFPPVLVTPPATKPVSLAEAKAHLRVDHADEDALIQGMLDAAVSHLDGYTGILGRAIIEQTWQQSFAWWDRWTLAFPDARDVVVTYLDAAGDSQTVLTSDYWLTGTHGGPLLSFRAAWTAPALLTTAGPAITVQFKTGWANAAAVPAALKAAILLHVGHLYANREAVADAGMAELPFAYHALVGPFRVVRM